LGGERKKGGGKKWGDDAFQSREEKERGKGTSLRIRVYKQRERNRKSCRVLLVDEGKRKGEKKERPILFQATNRGGRKPRATKNERWGGARAFINPSLLRVERE